MESTVVIVIPAHNVERTIVNLLESIDKFVPENVSITFVDDCSDDSTLEKVVNYKTDRDTQILPQMERGGPAVARNVGAANTSSEYILFLDSDVVLTEGFFEEIMKPFSEGGVVAVQGTYENANPSSIISVYEDTQIKMRQKPGFVKNLSSYALCVRRSAFRKVGGFDTKFPRACGEDTKLGFDLLKHGKLYLNDRAVVRHHHNTTIKGYMKKQFQRAQWRVYLYWKHPEMAGGDDYTSLRIAVQPFLALGSLLVFLSFFSGAYYWMGLICWDGLILIQLYEVAKTKGKKLRLVTYPLNMIRAYLWMFGFVVGVLWMWTSGWKLNS